MVEFYFQVCDSVYLEILNPCKKEKKKKNGKKETCEMKEIREFRGVTEEKRERTKGLSTNRCPVGTLKH